MVCPVARGRYPLGHRWGITVIPHPGPPEGSVMPGVGHAKTSVIARGGGTKPFDTVKRDPVKI